MNSKTTIDFERTAAAKDAEAASGRGAAGSGLSLRELQRPLTILTTPGYDLSVPIVYATATDGSKKFLRRRKVVDEVARDALPVHHRPTNDAVRMANAILLEQVLATGEYKNASRLATQIGISKNVLSDLPNAARIGQVVLPCLCQRIGVYSTRFVMP